MLIICPHCATPYEVQPTSVGEAGRSVRCVRCQTVWFAEAPQPDYAAAEPPLEMAALGEPALAENEAEPTQYLPASAETDAPADLSLPEAGSLAEIEAAVAEAERLVSETVDIPPLPDDRGPVDIIQSPPLVPPQEADQDAGSVLGAEATDAEMTAEDPSFPHNGHDIETLVTRRTQKILTRKKTTLAAAKLPALIMVLLTAVSSLLIWRKDVVRFAPQTASLYAAIGLKVNLRGLTFANIKTTTDMQDGIPVLVVQGQIVSDSRQPAEIPRMRFALRNASGHEIYSWTALAGRSILNPGEAIEFRSRLAAPPTEGRNLAVRFFNRRDMLAGIR